MLDRDRDALEATEQAEHIFQDNAFLHYAKGVALWDLGQTDNAEKELRRADELGSEDAAVALARNYELKGRYAEQAAVLSHAAERSATPYLIYLNLGYAQLAMGLPDRALKSFDQAESTSPFVGDAAAQGAAFRARVADGREAARHLQPR